MQAASLLYSRFAIHRKTVRCDCVLQSYRARRMASESEKFGYHRLLLTA